MFELSMYEFYLQCIDSNNDYDSLDAIIEKASEDESLTNKEYSALYEKAFSKLQTLSGI